jgi:hypothetical protein
MATHQLSSISAGSESEFSVPASKLRFIKNGSEQGDPPLRINSYSHLNRASSNTAICKNQTLASASRSTLLLDLAMAESSNVNAAAVFGLKVNFDALS